MTNTAAPATSAAVTLANIRTVTIENTAGAYAKQAADPQRATWAMDLCHDLALELNRRRAFEVRVRTRRTADLEADLEVLTGEDWVTARSELVLRAMY